MNHDDAKATIHSVAMIAMYIMNGYEAEARALNGSELQDLSGHLAVADEIARIAAAIHADLETEAVPVGNGYPGVLEYEVIEPLGKGMVLTTLRYDSTVRQPDTVFDEIKTVKLDKEMVELAQHIIDKKATRFDPSKFDDKYEDALIELIRAKKAGRKAPKAKAPSKPSNVVNLFDALKKSLAADNDESAPSVKATKSAKKKAPPAKKAAPKKKSA